MATAPAKPAAKPAAHEPHELRFMPGDAIFQKGDMGGDIFFIVSGSVEIFDILDNKEVTLSIMKEGEILGLLTCLTSSPRTAHARAKDTVLLKKVPHENIKSSLQALPKWMSTVIKEFSIRLQNTNASYASASLALQDAQRRMYGPMTLGLQFVSLLAHLAESMAIKVDDGLFVVVDDVLARMAELLVVDPKRVRVVYEAFLAGGLLKVEIEPDRKRKVIPKAVALAAKDFIAFHQKAGGHPVKRWVRQAIPDKSQRAAAALIAYARKQYQKPAEKTVVTGAELQERQEKMTGTPFDPEALSLFKALEMLTMTWNGKDFETLKVSFTPVSFGRTLAQIRVYRLLSEINFKALEAPADPKPAAKAS